MTMNTFFTYSFENQNLTLIFGGVFALIFGSFLGASSYRIARQYIEDLKLPIRFFERRSKCPSCGHKLKPMHLIPVLSWFILKGKCAFCGALISRKYLLIELGTLGSMIVAILVTPYAWDQTSLFMLGAMLMTLAVIDFKYLILPDIFLVPLLPFPLINLYFLRDGYSLINSLGGALLGVFLFAGVREAYLRFKKIEGLGIGDIKLIGVAGLWVGLQGISWMILTSVLVTLVGFKLFSKKPLNHTQQLPFGPGLCFGFYTVYLIKFLGFF